MFLPAVLVACGAFCASGLGRLLLGRVSIENPLRALAAQSLAGFFAYSALFGLAAHARLPFAAALVLCAALGVAALYGCTRSAGPEPRHGPLRLLLAALAGASFLAFASVKSLLGGGDPLNYAYLATVMFRDAWVREWIAHLPAYGALTSLQEVTALTRAPAVAALWLPAALGWNLDANRVTATSAWFLALAVVLLADTLSGFAPPLVRLILAAGGVGAFNAVSAVTFGQLNQSVALVAALAAVWCCRFSEAPRARLVTLGIMGNVLVAAYPEFLPAVPLYFGCIVLLRRTSFRGAACEAAVITLGALLVQASTRLASARYLLGQRFAAPLAWPLPAAPGNVAEVWSTILLERARWAWLLPALIGVVLYVWKSAPQKPPARPAGAAVRAVLIGLALMAGMWSWAALRSGNINYATFKLGGWLGPGLFLLGWLLLPPAGPTARRVLAAALLTLAVGRAADLGGELRRMTAFPTWIVWRPQLWTLGGPGAGGANCVVSAASARADVLEAAITESGAPAHGCAITVSGAAAVAARYRGRPPEVWRPKETQSYVMSIWNSSGEPWMNAGPGAVQLGVRFLVPGTDRGEWIRYPLPGPVAPVGVATARIELSAPGEPGRYILEHRVVKGGVIWSEQALLTPVTVE